MQHGAADGYAQLTAGGAIWRARREADVQGFYSQFSLSPGASGFY